VSGIKLFNGTCYTTEEKLQVTQCKATYYWTFVMGQIASHGHRPLGAK
jgi:hypothetical protein